MNNVHSSYAPSPELEEHPPSRRRQHALQPPSLLTTTVGNAHNLGQTPISATSLSSPFSSHQPSSYPGSAIGTMRGSSSPMVHRPSSAFNMAYNPQQWGPVSSGSNSIPTSASRSAAIRQPMQSTRVTALAARPVGPDGKLDVPSRCNDC